MIQDVPVNPRCPKIQFSEDEVKQFYKTWSKALVIRVLEKSFGYPALRRRLEFLWAKGGRIQVSDLSNDFFLVRFSDADDYQRAAFHGPWKMYDYYITVARWTPSFNEEEPIRTILTWVRLPKLHIHYFNHVAVNRIGNHIGKTIRMDLATAEGARARYARVCVEIDLSKPLLEKYMIGDRVFYIEYESIENFCYLCGLYGCKADSCPSCKLVVSPTEPSTVQEPEKEIVSDERDTGSWMVVSHKQRKKPEIPKNTVQSHKANKFEVLKTLPDDETGRSGSQASNPKPVKNQGTKSVNAPPKQTPQAPVRTDEDIIINWSPIPRAPLGDVTNVVVPEVEGSQQVIIHENNVQISTEGLVQVLVTYENPVFDSRIPRYVTNKTKSKSKGKSSLTKTSTSRIETKKPVFDDRPKIRTFKLHGFTQKPAAANAPVKLTPMNGRPPDPSQ
ncbi:hypothetical protein LINPERHAP2_LOCUS26163 [Linum perenne]